MTATRSSARIVSSRQTSGDDSPEVIAFKARQREWNRIDQRNSRLRSDLRRIVTAADPSTQAYTDAVAALTAHEQACEAERCARRAEGCPRGPESVNPLKNLPSSRTSSASQNADDAAGTIVSAATVTASMNAAPSTIGATTGRPAQASTRATPQRNNSTSTEETAPSGGSEATSSGSDDREDPLDHFRCVSCWNVIMSPNIIIVRKSS